MLAEHLVSVQKQILDWSGRLQCGTQSDSNVRSRLVIQFTNLQGSLSRVLAIGFGSGLLLVLVAWRIS